MVNSVEFNLSSSQDHKLGQPCQELMQFVSNPNLEVSEHCYTSLISCLALLLIHMALYSCAWDRRDTTSTPEVAI